jgi:Bacterial archaeo-eukaryotic release factor family 11
MHPPPTKEQFVNLHTDVPSRAQIDRLLTSRSPVSVSIYLATDPASSGEAERIELKNLAAEAARQLAEGGTAKADRGAVGEALGALDSDDTFWRYQARSLGLFATPATIVTFRLPNRLVSQVQVSDRFHLKPLLRAVTFPQVAFVLALAQGSVRVLEVGPEIGSWEVEVPDLPTDVASAAGMASIADRAPRGAVQGSEGQKVRMRQYSRQIDQALRPILAGLDVPLILASTEPLDAIYRSVNTYPHLAAQSVAGSPEAASNTDLVAGARTVLDEVHAAALASVRELYERRSSQGRSMLDVGDIARAATFGAVETVIVDIDDVVPGTVDEESGAVAFAEVDDAVAYGVVDEIARRTWLHGGRVLAVRREDVPGGGAAAAILRYAV